MSDEDPLIRLTRSQVTAALVTVGLLLAGTLALGYALGVRRDAPSARREFVPAQGDLHELVERVGSADAPDGGVGALTFPDALKGQGGDGTPAPAPATDTDTDALAVVAPGDAVPVADEAPAGVFTLDCGRFPTLEEARAAQRGLDGPSWVGATLVDGAPSYRLAIGGFPDEAAATAALQALPEGTRARAAVAAM
jgi:hypothetical protein